MQSMEYIDKSPSKGKQDDSPSLPRKGDNTWSPERVKMHHLSKLQARFDISQDPAMRVNFQPSIMMRQTVWTGVDYCPECNPSPSSMPTWDPTHSLHSDDILRSCSQKIGNLKKSHKVTEGKKHKEKDKTTKKELLKPCIVKSASEDIPSLSVPTTPILGKKRVKRKPTRIKKITNYAGSSTTEDVKNDTDLQVEPLKVDDYRKPRDTNWKKPIRQPVARNRFRKGGIVATATVRTYADQDNETDVEEKTDNTSGNKKKKKKRKLLNLHKRVRKAIATVTTVANKPNTNVNKSTKQR